MKVASTQGQLRMKLTFILLAMCQVIESHSIFIPDSRQVLLFIVTPEETDSETEKNLPGDTEVVSGRGKNQAWVS